MKIWHSKRQTSGKFRERRLDIRKPTTINAVICYEKSAAVPCVISSLSLTGMLLELTEKVHFELGTLLQLVFYSTIDHCRKVCCEWVSVAGMRENGVAVRFAHFDHEHQTNIQQMLHQAMTHSPPLPLKVNTNQKGFSTSEHSQKTA
jgi:hypothetical protein